MDEAVGRPVGIYSRALYRRDKLAVKGSRDAKEMLSLDPSHPGFSGSSLDSNEHWSNST